MNDPTYGLTFSQRRRAIWYMAVAVALVLGYWLLFYVAKVGNHRSFTVSAVTQKVSVVVRGKDGASVLLPPDTSLVGGARFDRAPLLYIPEGATIALARKAEGPVRLQVRNSKADSRASLTTADGEKRYLESSDTLEIDTGQHGNVSGRSFVMPYQGQVRLGTELRDSVEYMLLSGAVTVVDKPPISDRMVVDRTTVEAGDDLHWTGTPTDDAEPRKVPELAAGFISVGEGPALQVVAHINARKLTVSRFGAEDYDIEPSPLDSAANDFFLSAILFPTVTFLGAIYLLFEAILKLRELYRRPGNHRHKAAGSKNAH